MGDLNDTEEEQVEQTDNEEEEEELQQCDWCGGTVRSDEQKQLLMIWDEGICQKCVDGSDLQVNEAGEYDYAPGQFDDGEASSDEGIESDVSVIILSDSEDEA